MGHTADTLILMGSSCKQIAESIERLKPILNKQENCVTRKNQIHNIFLARIC